MLAGVKGFFQGLSTLRLIGMIGGLIGVLAGGSGFYAGQRWEKGAALDDYKEHLSEIQQSFSDEKKQLNAYWVAEWEKAQGEIVLWQRQVEADNAVVMSLNGELSALRKEFNEIITEANDLDAFGECVFTADAISLLHSTTASSANARSLQTSD